MTAHNETKAGREPLVYSSVVPKFKRESDEIDHLEIWVHATLKGNDQAALYAKAKAFCATANAAPDLLAAMRDLIQSIEFTPLGVRALKALEAARAALALATSEAV